MKGHITRGDHPPTACSCPGCDCRVLVPVTDPFLKEASSAPLLIVSWVLVGVLLALNFVFGGILISKKRTLETISGELNNARVVLQSNQDTLSSFESNTKQKNP
jgi:hypothetical protein